MSGRWRGDSGASDLRRKTRNSCASRSPRGETGPVFYHLSSPPFRIFPVSYASSLSCLTLAFLPPPSPSPRPLSTVPCAPPPRNKIRFDVNLSTDISSQRGGGPSFSFFPPPPSRWSSVGSPRIEAEGMPMHEFRL